MGKPAAVPSVGRIVHYVSYGTPGGEYPKACRAAVITAVPDVGIPEGGAVGLCVLNPTGQSFNPSIPHDSGHVPDHEQVSDLCHGLDYDGGTWHWPERV